MDVNFRSAQVHDMPRIKEIISLSFDDAAKHQAVLSELENEPWYSAGHWLVGEVAGRVLCALALRPGTMWIAGTGIPTSTVGAVCTHPDFRGAGIGAQLMRYADGVMQRQEVVVSRLHTSAARFGFYGRLGYVKTVTNQPATVFEVEAVGARTRRRAEAELGDAVIRPAHPRDAMRMLDIYHATFSMGTGCISRNELFFLRRIARWPKMWFWYAPKFDVVDDPVHGVVGYVAYLLEEESRQLVELATLPQHAPAARTLLLHVAREAQRLGVKKLDTAIDRHHPLGWIVSEFPIDGATDSFIMFLKVQDEERFVELMRPAVERRCSRFEVKLTLRLAGLGNITLGSGQEIGIVSDVQHLAALVYNGAWLAGLMGQGSMFIEPETVAAHEAVRAVFPDTHAFRCRLDGF